MFLHITTSNHPSLSMALSPNPIVPSEELKKIYLLYMYIFFNSH